MGLSDDQGPSLKDVGDPARSEYMPASSEDARGIRRCQLPAPFGGRVSHLKHIPNGRRELATQRAQDGYGKRRTICPIHAALPEAILPAAVVQTLITIRRLAFTFTLSVALDGLIAFLSGRTPFCNLCQSCAKTFCHCSAVASI